MDLDHIEPRERLAFATAGGIAVSASVYAADYGGALAPLVRRLDSARGVVLSSSFEYPNRYTRWDFGFADPPLEITAKGRVLTVTPLNERGRVLAPAIQRAVAAEPMAEVLGEGRFRVGGQATDLTEEGRTRRPTVFTLLRRILDLFRSAEDGHLGLYGAFGYDLAFQWDPIEEHIRRPDDQRDLVLFLPDEVLVVDHLRQQAVIRRYEFAVDGAETRGFARTGGSSELGPPRDPALQGDHGQGEYASSVAEARERFRVGDMFESVLSQTFYRRCELPPSEIFEQLKLSNPSPYGALMNLGDGEFLVAASPEMFVRVTGERVETCPISGTIARGADAVSDAEQIRTLLNSAKDEAELTMCTDVDRNDKSRVCVPGSVKVIGRRQIEVYSRLIHTVDHVEGRLRPGMDGLDAFLTHAWAVTVTGAPKRRAMQFIESREKGSRRWYGGAIGMLGFDGNVNTGLTLRTLRLKDGIAEARVGATLLYDSEPEAEDAECRLKVSALLAVLEGKARGRPQRAAPRVEGLGAGRRVLLVDHEDSFVLTLADYVRQTGAEVTTLRPDLARAALSEMRPDLVMLSPGPGRPADFDLSATIGAALERGLPLFGVCLGLQGIAEYYGGTLGVLPLPEHGKPADIRLQPDPLFADLPESIQAARYHSLYAERETLPKELSVIAESGDGVIMAIAHRHLAVRAVQFHPESILSVESGAGLRIIGNMIAGIGASG